MAPTDGDGPPSQGEFGAIQSAASDDDEPALPPSPSTDQPLLWKAAPLALSGTSINGVPDLTRTDSSDGISLRSHTSIPVVGHFPLGSLRVHKAMDSPRLQPPGTLTQPEDPNMPPLERSSAAATGEHELTAESRGDVFLILDLPADSTVGCDARAFGAGTSGTFQGICDIPPGAHFIWISVPNTMSRCGYWFVSEGGGGEVRVKQWDRFNEVLVEPASNFESRDHRANIAALYPQLVPYGYGGGADTTTTTTTAVRPAQASDEDEAQLWQRLTSCISPRLLARVVRGKVDSSAPSAAHEWLVDTSDSAAGDAGFPQTRTSALHQTLVGGAGELHFLFPDGDVDVHAHDATATGGTTTPDTSDDIERLADALGTGGDLVGELQFAFLTGLHLGNLACVEQWWHLVLEIVLRAHRLVASRPGLARALVAVLHAQLVYDEKYIVNEFEDDAAPRREYGGPPGGGGASTSILDIVPGNRRRLRAALTLYKRRMNEILLPSGTDDETSGGGRRTITDEQAEVGRAFEEIEAWFWKFGWDLRTDYVGEKRKNVGGSEELGGQGGGMGYAEDDEYRPVIVELDEQGREVGLVSFD